MDFRIRVLLLVGGISLLGVGTAFCLERGRQHVELGLTQLFQGPVQIKRLSFLPGRLTLHQVNLRSSFLTIERLQIQGSLFLLLKPRFPGIRSIQVTGFTLLLAGEPLHGKGHASLTPQPEAPPRWQGEFAFEHPFLQGHMEVSGKFAEPILVGWIQGPGRLRRHFQGEFLLDREGLRILRMEIQGGFHLSGTLQSSGLDLLFQLDGVDLSDPLTWALPEVKAPRLLGRVSGTFRLQGPLDQLASQGELTSRNGRLGEKEFRLADLRFTGKGPLLKIQDSQLVKPSGVLLLEGSVDLRRLGKPDFLQGIQLTSTEKTLDLGGWSMGPSSQPGALGLQIRRIPGEDQKEVNLAYEVDEAVKPEPVARGKVEVKVPITEEERLKIRMDQSESFLGVERRGKF